VWLTSLLEDPEEKIRRYAMVALTKLGGGESGEAKLLEILENPASSREDRFVAQTIERIGGEETVLSYPITRDEYMALDMEQLTERLATLVPQAHVAFVEGFEDQIIIGDYAFVHAGIRPGVALADQKPSDLRWIRDEFVGQRGDLEKVIVYGHTIYEEVEERGSRIGIDTGAYDSGKLTALALEGGDRWYLQT
jgi:serine/threonine protein phosphatase 1